MLRGLFSLFFVGLMSVAGFSQTLLVPEQFGHSNWYDTSTSFFVEYDYGQARTALLQKLYGAQAHQGSIEMSLDSASNELDWIAANINNILDPDDYSMVETELYLLAGGLDSARSAFDTWDASVDAQEANRVSIDTGHAADKTWYLENPSVRHNDWIIGCGTRMGSLNLINQACGPLESSGATMDSDAETLRSACETLKYVVEDILANQ